MIDDLQAMAVCSTRNTAIAFRIPPEAQADFARAVPYEAQKEVRRLLHAMEEIHRAKNVNAACRRLAAGFAARADLQGKRGLTSANLRQKYYWFIKGHNGFAAGDYRILLNKAKAPQAAKGLPGAFLEFWRLLCEQNQRVNSDALRELHRIYQTHHDARGKRHTSIPGYADWPEADPRTGVPVGWTENLYRYAPSRFELKAARVGLKAASARGLKVRTTRVGLRIGEFMEFDDHEYNLVVNFPGQWKAMRPQGFAAVDVLSGHCFSHIVKRVLWDQEEQKKRVLTQRDFMWFWINALMQTGYRTDDAGTTLNVEHAKATIPEVLAARLSDLTGGKVRVAMGGIHDRRAHGGQMPASAGGNPRFKPHVEGFFRLLDDRLAALPGQVGKDRDHSPQQLPGIGHYNQSLLKAAADLSPERAALLQWPVLLWHEFCEQVDRVMGDIGGDTGHQLEGWEKLKFIVQEPREGVALPMARRMSRREVFQRFQHELHRLEMYHLPALVGPENALRNGEPLTVRGGEFEFEDGEISGEPFRYYAATEEGRPLREGEKYLCFANRINPAFLVACDARLRVVAVCAPVAMPCKNDVAGVQRELGRQGHWTAATLEDQRARHEPEARALEHMRQHNAAVREGKILTEAEQAEAQRIRECPVTMQDLVAAGAASQAAAEEPVTLNQEKLAAFKLLMPKTTTDPDEHHHP